MPWSDRVFRALLRLLPEEFRDAYRRDMEATFRAQRRDDAPAAGGRPWRRARLWLATVADVVASAPSEHADILRRDLRVAWRLMAARPLHTLTALLTLAIGIGANVAMFGVVDQVLLAPLPYRNPQAVVAVEETRDGAGAGPTGYLSFLDVHARARAFDALAAATVTTATVTGDGRDAERVSAMRVSRAFFDVLGAAPARGRTFSEGEDAPGAARQVVIISDGFRQRRFGASDDVVGRPLLIGGLPFTIIGVMPASFGDLVSARLYDGAELWTPLGYDPAAAFACRTCRHLRVFGRLAPGMSAARAEAEVSAIYRSLEQAYPADYRAAGVRVTPLTDFFLGPVRPVLFTLWAGVALLFVVACLHVANLLMLRAHERAPEMAVRMALGVTRARLVRQLLTEAALLAALAGGLALGPAWLAMRAAALQGPTDMPRLSTVAFDARVVIAAVVLTAIAGIVSGLVPILRSAPRPAHDLLQGGRRSTPSAAAWRARAALVAFNVALTVVLLVGSGLLVRSLQTLLLVAPGFDPRQAVTLQIALSGERYRHADDRTQLLARVVAFYDEVLARTRALPGVERAAAVHLLPMGGDRDSIGFHIDGRPMANPAAAPSAHRFAVTPDFAQTMRIPLLRGRLLDARDGPQSEPAVLIGQRTAEELFPGEDPLGRRVSLGPPTARPRTIVGVVGDLRHEGLHAPVGYQVYVPQAQWGWPETEMTLVVRGPGDLGAIAGAIRQIVRAIDPSQPITAVERYEAVVARTMGARRFAAWLLGGFAAAALAMALVGLYGALAVAVGHRQREIGVRLALGARAGAIRAMVLRQGLGPAAVGLAAGLGAALAGAQGLGTLLYGVPPLDLAAFAGAAVTLAAGAVLACLIPAWRAARIDPVEAMRAE